MYSICREEIEALSEIAHQINHKLNADVNSNVATSHQQSNESVDLDNLFAFLSEVTPNNSNSNNSNTSSSHSSNNSSSSSNSSNNGNEHDNININKNNGNNNNNNNNGAPSIIDDIEETFHDLDVELENVLQQEMEIMENERSNANKCMANAKMGVPSLPEPTTRPPPPPKVIPKTAPNAISNNSPMGLNVIDLSTEVIPLSKPPQKPNTMKTVPSSATAAGKRKEEPIYEAVIPRHELPPVAEIPEPMPPNSYEFNQKLRFVKLKEFFSKHFHFCTNLFIDFSVLPLADPKVQLYKLYVR